MKSIKSLLSPIRPYPSSHRASIQILFSNFIRESDNGAGQEVSYDNGKLAIICLCLN